MVGHGEKPQNQKPTPIELDLQRLAEITTLANYDEMSARLHTVLSASKQRELLIPLLLETAGKTMNVTEVPKLIIHALRSYMRQTNDMKKDIRADVVEIVPLIIDAMIPDPTARQKARDLLASAING